MNWFEELFRAFCTVYYVTNRLLFLTWSDALYKRSQHISGASFMAYHILAYRHFKTSNDASWLFSVYFKNDSS